MNIFLIYNLVQIFNFVVVCSVQFWRNLKTIRPKVFQILLKSFFSFQIFKIYSIALLSEITMIYDLIFNEKINLSIQAYLLTMLEDNLFYLSLIVFFGVLLIYCFLKIIAVENIKLKNFLQQPLSLKSQIILRSLLYTMLFQLAILFFVHYFHIRDPVDQLQFIKVVYVRLLLFLSAISSMYPLIKVLISDPIDLFFENAEFRTLDYQYDQLIEDQDNLLGSDSESGSEISMQKFDQDENDEIRAQYVEKKSIRDQSIIVLRRVLIYSYKVLKMTYLFMQMIFSLIVLIGLIFIIIEMMNPEVQIIKQMNFINLISVYFQRDQPKPNKFSQILSIIGVFLFKIFFMVIMYLSSKGQIEYKQTSKPDIHNIIVIVRRSLLNFSLIALMTTLYPNLTMTINNSDCFKEITYKRGQFMFNNKERDSQCPMTIIGLFSLKIFENQSISLIGMLTLLLYIFHSISILFKRFFKY